MKRSSGVVRAILYTVSLEAILISAIFLALSYSLSMAGGNSAGLMTAALFVLAGGILLGAFVLRIPRRYVAPPVKQAITRRGLLRLVPLLALSWVLIFLVTLVSFRHISDSRRSGLLLFFSYALILMALIMAMRNQVAFSAQDKVQSEGMKKVRTWENDRRFTFVTEQVKDAQAFGYVSGTLCKGDKIYIYNGSESARKARVTAIRTETDVTEVSDREAWIALEKEEPAYFEVLSSIQPLKYEDTDTPVENAVLLAYIDAYERLKDLPEYAGRISYELCHAHYLVRGIFDREVTNPLQRWLNSFSGMYQSVQYPTVSRKGDDMSAFPVYTDRTAYDRMPQDEVKGTAALVYTFQELYPIWRKGEGVAINPFGPRDLFLPMSVIEGIVHSEGYQNEFEHKEK